MENDFLNSLPPALRAPPLHSGEGEQGSIIYGYNNNISADKHYDGLLSLSRTLHKYGKRRAQSIS